MTGPVRRTTTLKHCGRQLFFLPNFWRGTRSEMDAGRGDARLDRDNGLFGLKRFLTHFKILN